MQRNFTRLLLSAVLMMCCTMMYAEIEPTQPQTDGNGNYELRTAAELYWFAKYVNNGNTSANAILTEDITVNESVLDSNGDLASGTFETWTPIGEGADDKAYSGEFNGNGHTISGLYCKDTGKNNIGLFGKANNEAYIHDLGLKDSYFSGNSWVAGICGDFASGRIENCWNGATVIANSTVNGGSCAGGITASCWTAASIRGCYNIGKISVESSNKNQCGGICGTVAKNIGVDCSVSYCVSLEGKCDSHKAYNLYNSDAVVENVVTRNSDAFESGEVCWLLNNGVTDGSQKWYQTLEEDDTPSLSTSRGIIFKITDDQGKCEYANAKCQHEQTYKSYQAAVCPTATTTGRYGHWHCSHCSTDFMNESCTIEATEENLTVPVATNKEIWYTTINNQKLEPYSKNAFGAIYDDANNVYEKGLGKITFDKDITSFGDNAFRYCSGLTSIEIPNSVTSIGAYAFRNCSGLTSIEIPNSVTSIEYMAFYDCSGLISVIFYSLPDLGNNAFIYCDNLKTKILDLTDSDKPYIGSSTANYPGFTSANYHGTLTPNTWGTIVLPFIPESTEALEFYRYMAVDAGKVRVSKVQDVQAGVPYLIKNVSESADFTLMVKNPSQIKVTATDQTVQTFTLKGSFREKSLKSTENQNLYILDDGIFKRIADMQTIAPFRAYIESSESPEVQSMDIELFQHTPTFVNDGYIPTATTSGRYGHWHCSHCNKDFIDESCTTEATDENLAVPPVATNKEIWYTTINNQKLEPYSKNAFGATYDDANNVYEKGLGKIAFDTDVTSFGNYAFYNCGLTSIEIPNSVTSIGDNAFFGCSGLTSIEIPNSVTSIGRYAFYNCGGLTSIEIPNSVTSIGDYAFFGCSGLTSIEIPNSVTSIGVSAFDNCSGLTSVIFHSLPDVGWNAFEYRNNLKTKTLDLTDSENPYIGTSLEYYPSGGFTEAKYTFSLAKNSWGTVVLPFVPSSESISNLEFYSYEGVDDGKVFVLKATNIQAGVPYLIKNVSESADFTLTATNPTITLTAGSTSADGFTFKGCFRSSDIDANSNLYYLDGTVFQKASQDNNVAPLHAYIEAPETFEKESMGVEIWNPETAPVFVGGVVPTATTTGRYGYWLDKSQNKKYWNKICTRTITDDSELTVSVDKDNEIWYTTTDNKLIENGVNFKTNEYHYGLGKIVLADGVTEIADNAFKGKTTLMSMYIPSSVKKIGKYSFSGCTFLQSVLLSSGLEVIDDNAFDACTGLTSITIPETVTRIGKSVFAVSESENKSLQTVTIPENSQLETIDDNAFNRCRVLQSIRIPSSVKKIGNSSFWGCTALESVTFSSLPVVDQYAFGSCGSLSSKILDLTDSEKPYVGTSTSNYPDFTEARYHRTLEKDKWGTIVLPFKPSSTEGLKFYALQSMTLRQAQGESGNDGSLVFTKVDAPETGIPYLFRNEGESADFTLTAETPSSIILETQEIGPDNFKMKGRFQSVQLNGVTNNNLYYLKDNEFYHANSKINIAPFRAYIEAYIEGSEAAQAKSFMLVISDNGDDVTAVPGILNGDGSIDETEAIYDLSGRKLSAPVKGQVNIIRTKSGKTIKRMF